MNSDKDWIKELPKVVSNRPTISLFELVHFIDTRDIERYIIDKHLDCPNDVHTESIIKSETKRIYEELTSAGYEITNVKSIVEKACKATKDRCKAALNAKISEIKKRRKNRQNEK